MILLENLPARAEMADAHADPDDPVATGTGREKYTLYLQILSDAAMESIFHAVNDQVRTGIRFRTPSYTAGHGYGRNYEDDPSPADKKQGQSRSIHVAYVDVGSCNGCDIEILACLAPAMTLNSTASSSTIILARQMFFLSSVRIPLDGRRNLPCSGRRFRIPRQRSLLATAPSPGACLIEGESFR